MAAVILAGIACGGSSSSPTSPSPSPKPTTAPILVCPADVAAISPTGSGMPVSFATPTATGGVAPVTVSCTPASGTTFPVGTTMVRCTATAANGDTATCSLTVEVRATAPTQQISRTRFLAFGDSMTAGEVSAPAQMTGQSGAGVPWWPLVLVPQASYPTQLDLQLRARYSSQSASISVTNAGKSGEYASDAARRFTEVIANLRPEVVLILEGANDLSLGTTGVSRALAGVESMAKDARFRNARVFIATMPPPGRSGSRALPASTVTAYNSRLVDLARGEGAVLVDLYSALLSNVSTYIGSDGLHPTEAGYRRMADAFFDAIRQSLEVR